MGPEAKMMSLMVPQGEEWHLFSCPNSTLEITEMPFQIPRVWAEDNPLGLARNILPVVIELKPRAEPGWQKQYHLPPKAWAGIQTPKAWHPLAMPVMLEYSAVTCPEAGDGRLSTCPRLNTVNPSTVTLHPVVPNPCTLLGRIPPEATSFTCLDFKDAFFCICLAPKSQLIFAFQWENPEFGEHRQFTWTRLP